MDIFTIDLVDEDVLDFEMASEDTMCIQLYSEDVFSIDLVVGGYMYENDYNKLDNKPSINNVILEGNRTFEDLGRYDISNSRIKQIVDDAFDLIMNNGGN